ncbi:nitroreductase family protein [Oceanispirochaeta crateris]|uniref:nitroreductase family protein n=1 Tax=Oceanispirochaeta crateris TaxID=2518645 RepID=UPI001AEFAD5E|nr:nitroreductase family protein [Oceanispirochaeta crateris]
MNRIFERRSINFFDPARELEDSLLKEIIDLAANAPSAFNLQPWDIIAVKSDEAKKKLHGLANQQPKILEAPVTLILSGDRSAYGDDNPQWSFMRENYGNDGAERAKGAASFLYGSTEERKIKFAESNTGLLAMSIMYAAKSLGVDSHPMSGIDFEGIKTQFGLEGEKEVVMLIALGYFDEEKVLHSSAPRRRFESLVKIA